MLLQTTGVTFNQDHVDNGYILFAPVAGSQAYLINYAGEVVHNWSVGKGFTNWTYLLPNGNLFMNECSDEPQGVKLTCSGRMREYDKHANLVWEHHDPWQHHDARRLANGNAVYLAFTPMSKADQSRIKGGVAGSESGPDMFGECIREVDANGQVVWEWHFSEFQEGQFPIHPKSNRWSRGHTNTVFPMADGNYLVSSKILNLLFIIDRQSSKVIWYYQNDLMGGQHDAQQLDNGNILIFANGAYSTDLHFSAVWELDPKTKEIVWQFRAKDNPQSFFSPHVGGSQRLSSGNTLVCEGAKGCIFVVTPNGDIVWEYVNPYTNDAGQFGAVNWLFRARHYNRNSNELSTLV